MGLAEEEEGWVGSAAISTGYNIQTACQSQPILTGTLLGQQQRSKRTLHQRHRTEPCASFGSDTGEVKGSMSRLPLWITEIPVSVLLEGLR